MSEFHFIIIEKYLHNSSNLHQIRFLIDTQKRNLFQSVEPSPEYFDFIR